MVRKILLINLIVACLVTSLSVQDSVDKASTSASLPNRPHEDLDALLWMQTSAEYEVITVQTFRLAKQVMCQALCSPTWTAFVNQAISTAVPGSTELIQACRLAQVQVLFVTNRDHAVEQVRLER